MTEFSGIWSVGDVLGERALHKPTSALKHLLKLQTRTQVARAGSHIEIFFRRSHGVEHFEHHHIRQSGCLLLPCGAGGAAAVLRRMSWNVVLAKSMP